MSLRIISLLLLLEAAVPGFCSSNKQSDDFKRVLFVINSQAHSVHRAIAQQARKTLESDLRGLGVKTPKVFLAHQDEDIPRQGAWTYIPTIEYLSLNYGKAISWVLFVEEDTVVNLPVLKEILKAENPKREVYIGHALKGQGGPRRGESREEQEDGDLSFPHVAAGFLMSVEALHAIKEKVAELRDTTDFPHYISMNPHFELAKIVGQTRRKLHLTHDRRFCVQHPPADGEETCATFPRKASHNASSEDVIRLAKETLFAVKTCQKFHSTRLPIVRDTWHAAALNIEYFSEVKDAEFETKVLHGVRNTEKGHCRKSEAIVNYFTHVAEEQGYRWLVLADDDTVLGVAKLMGLLRLYDDAATGREAVLLGERYGHNVVSGSYGYDYITGGGGMVFNLEAAQKMARKKNVCSCPQEDYFDDLHIGECFMNLDVPLVHSARFHQRRPEEYPSELLQDDPVSFHKFDRTDPRKTYDTYFRETDQLLIDYKVQSKLPRTEL